ncbi:hypothetical protein KKH82_03395 [Patescibacteria group bacterium]|nr:hypothetical protein [Patescibacteria group bacterium]
MKVSKIQIDKPTIVHVTLREGKKRHIRRMFRSLGYRVWDLQRIREGEFTLGDLPIGEWKVASKDIH